jgi:hypothetical protein
MRDQSKGNVCTQWTDITSTSTENNNSKSKDSLQAERALMYFVWSDKSQGSEALKAAIESEGRLPNHTADSPMKNDLKTSFSVSPYKKPNRATSSPDKKSTYSRGGLSENQSDI